jgi:DICT domain-containing protein
MQAARSPLRRTLNKLAYFLPAAIAQAVAGHPAEDQWLFAVLRRRHPALRPQILRKAALLALTWAVEDEYCARSERAFLFGRFQQQRFFRQSEDRWNELARTAEAVVVFAVSAGAATAPRQVPVPAGAPLRREWVLVCEARDYPSARAAGSSPAGGRSGTSHVRRLASALDRAEEDVVSIGLDEDDRLGDALRPGAPVKL